MKFITSRLLLILLFVPCLFADDLVWGGSWAGVWSGFGTSPYTAINKSQNNKVLVIFCLDYNDEIAPPIEWLANIRPVTQSNVDNYAQFGGSYQHGITTVPWAFNGDPGVGVNSTHAVDLSPSGTAYTRYLEAAWLFTNILAAQTHNDLNSMIVSQVAAWDLFVEDSHVADLRSRISDTNSLGAVYNFGNYEYSTNQYATPPATNTITHLLFQDAVDEALTAAQNAVLNQSWYSSVNAPSWDLVTADPDWTTQYKRPVQEFLTDAPPVPEASSIFLLGTVTLLAFLAMRRKMQRA